MILSDGRREIYRLDRSPNPPQVTVNQPGNGKPVSGPVSATWSTSDADGDALTYTVLYSDDGATWKPLALDWSKPNLDLDGAYLPGSGTARLRVIASDGLNFTAAESPSFEVPKHAPTVKIMPVDPEASPWQAGIPNFLAADAVDIEDGTLPETAYEWKSDRDGVLSEGSILHASLSAGEHSLSVTVSDSDGQQASASVNISVQGQKPPLTGLWSPMIPLYAIGCLVGLAGFAVMGRGLWLAATLLEGALAALQKEGKAWNRRYQRGQVAPNAVPQILEQLRTRDRRGIWWALDPFRGLWLSWDGQVWRPTLPPKVRGKRLGCGLALIVAGLSTIAAIVATLWWLGF